MARNNERKRCALLGVRGLGQEARQRGTEHWTSSRRLWRGHVPTVLDILSRAALNMACTFQGNLGSNVSINLMRLRIRHQGDCI